MWIETIIKFAFFIGILMFIYMFVKSLRKPYELSEDERYMKTVYKLTAWVKYGDKEYRSNFAHIRFYENFFVISTNKSYRIEYSNIDHITVPDFFLKAYVKITLKYSDKPQPIYITTNEKDKLVSILQQAFTQKSIRK